MKYPLILSIILTMIFSAEAQTNKDSLISFKILTFNILHGATTQNTFDLDTIAHVINHSDADFVALQEVDFKTSRAQRYDLATELAIRTDRVPIFGRAMFYDGGEYGEAILSKHTILKSENIPLPYTQGKEPRTALAITTVLPSRDTIVIIGTHLDHTEDEANRLLQAKAINLHFRNSPYPTVLAGDLNATPESNTIKLFEEIWTPSYKPHKPEPTYPSDNPTVKIDYILYAPETAFKVVERTVLQNTVASDHCGYLVKLVLR